MSCIHQSYCYWWANIWCVEDCVWSHLSVMGSGSKTRTGSFFLSTTFTLFSASPGLTSIPFHRIYFLEKGKANTIDHLIRGCWWTNLHPFYNVRHMFDIETFPLNMYGLTYYIFHCFTQQPKLLFSDFSISLSIAFTLAFGLGIALQAGVLPTCSVANLLL